ncbi:acyltransferase ChoActase/COT/CPT [Crucibulum laeve]|uniref:Carnitine O-acetyltransferase, mitochondrial n=1 Tax=Crucibulum laeve TaxID=68775 RepID=A0A5C3M5B1_9AGAR|nr:acyltransferase ChoActase/COT/CPT [Crucibulum laeve]
MTLAMSKAPTRKSSTAPQDPPPGYSIDSNAPPMLRYQSSLPRLPVPTLASTCAKYLETVQPLLSPAQFSKTQASVSSFLSSPLASELQKRLESRAAEPGMKNWLSDWWNDAAYMGYRDPVVVFVSYFFVHADDRSRRDPAARAASLVKAMLPFREMVESGTLEPEKARLTPLCMSSYKYLFHASRYPALPSDTADKFDPKSHNHIVVVHQNRFYAVPLASPSGAELSVGELEAQFARIIRAGKDKTLPIGALTSDNRDKWFHAREALLKASPKNAELLKTIESAMIVVALDDTAPVTREDISWSCWVGDGRNRWFDKHQLIVFKNGRSGFLGEHSCMDGTPTLRLNEFVLASLALNKVNLGTPLKELNDSQIQALPQPQELTFEVNSQVKSLVKEAESRFDELVGAHDLHVLHYEGFGKNLCKTHKFSPDATAQLIKQLAFHKMFGRPGVTYESAQTRKFQLGRTEVIRSVSNESGEWARAMLSSEKQDPLHLRTLFSRAVQRHMQYSSWAADGQGVDRHLFGLKKLLKEGEELPEIYKDEAFAKSSHWELSTSQLSSKYFDGWGYGEVVPDGYGLSYAIGDDYIRWTITSLKLRTAELKHHLAEAATEVKQMLEAAAKAEKGKGKL